MFTNYYVLHVFTHFYDQSLLEEKQTNPAASSPRELTDAECDNKNGLVYLLTLQQVQHNSSRLINKWDSIKVALHPEVEQTLKDYIQLVVKSSDHQVKDELIRRALEQRESVLWKELSSPQISRKNRILEFVAKLYVKLVTNKHLLRELLLSYLSGKFSAEDLKKAKRQIYGSEKVTKEHLEKAKQQTNDTGKVTKEDSEINKQQTKDAGKPARLDEQVVQNNTNGSEQNGSDSRYKEMHTGTPSERLQLNTDAHKNKKSLSSTRCVTSMPQTMIEQSRANLTQALANVENLPPQQGMMNGPFVGRCSNSISRPHSNLLEQYLFRDGLEVHAEQNRSQQVQKSARPYQNLQNQLSQYQSSQNPQNQPSQNLQNQPSQNLQNQPSQNLQNQPSQNLQNQPSQNLQNQPSQNLQNQPSQNPIIQPSQNLPNQLAQNLLHLPSASQLQGIQSRQPQNVQPPTRQPVNPRHICNSQPSSTQRNARSNQQQHQTQHHTATQPTRNTQQSMRYQCRLQQSAPKRTMDQQSCDVRPSKRLSPDTQVPPPLHVSRQQSMPHNQAPVWTSNPGLYGQQSQPQQSMHQTHSQYVNPPLISPPTQQANPLNTVAMGPSSGDNGSQPQHMQCPNDRKQLPDGINTMAVKVSDLLEPLLLEITKMVKDPFWPIEVTPLEEPFYRDTQLYKFCRTCCIIYHDSDRNTDLRRHTIMYQNHPTNVFSAVRLREGEPEDSVLLKCALCRDKCNKNVAFRVVDAFLLHMRKHQTSRPPVMSGPPQVQQPPNYNYPSLMTMVNQQAPPHIPMQSWQPPNQQQHQVPNMMAPHSLPNGNINVPSSSCAPIWQNANPNFSQSYRGPMVSANGNAVPQNASTNLFTQALLRSQRQAQARSQRRTTVDEMREAQPVGNVRQRRGQSTECPRQSVPQHVEQQQSNRNEPQQQPPQVSLQQKQQYCQGDRSPPQTRVDQQMPQQNRTPERNAAQQASVIVDPTQGSTNLQRMNTDQAVEGSLSGIEVNSNSRANSGGIEINPDVQARMSGIEIDPTRIITIMPECSSPEMSEDISRVDHTEHQDQNRPSDADNHTRSDGTCHTQQRKSPSENIKTEPTRRRFVMHVDLREDSTSPQPPRETSPQPPPEVQAPNTLGASQPLALNPEEVDALLNTAPIEAPTAELLPPPILQLDPNDLLSNDTVERVENSGGYAPIETPPPPLIEESSSNSASNESSSNASGVNNAVNTLKSTHQVIGRVEQITVTVGQTSARKETDTGNLTEAKSIPATSKGSKPSDIPATTQPPADVCPTRQLSENQSPSKPTETPSPLKDDNDILSHFFVQMTMAMNNPSANETDSPSQVQETIQSFDPQAGTQPAVKTPDERCQLLVDIYQDCSVASPAPTVAYGSPGRELTPRKSISKYDPLLEEVSDEEEDVLLSAPKAMTPTFTDSRTSQDVIDDHVISARNSQVCNNEHPVTKSNEAYVIDISDDDNDDSLVVID